MSAEELIERLISRYRALNRYNFSWLEFEAYRKPIEIRVANSIIQWMKKIPQDFIPSETGLGIAQTVIDFVDQVVESDNPALARQIRKAIEKI